MLLESLCAGDATSPGTHTVQSHDLDIPLSLEPWTLVQIVTALNIIDNLPTPSCIHSFLHFPPFLHASFLRHIVFDYSLRLLLPFLCFFSPSPFIHDIHEILRRIIHHENINGLYGC